MQITLWCTSIWIPGWGLRSRDLRLEELLRKRGGQIDVPNIMECMKDHGVLPESICAHKHQPART